MRRGEFQDLWLGALAGVIFALTQPTPGMAAGARDAQLSGPLIAFIGKKMPVRAAA